MELDEQETIMQSSCINFLFGAGLFIWIMGTMIVELKPRF